MHPSVQPNPNKKRLQHITYLLPLRGISLLSSLADAIFTKQNGLHQQNLYFASSPVIGSILANENAFSASSNYRNHGLDYSGNTGMSKKEKLAEITTNPRSG